MTRRVAFALMLAVAALVPRAHGDESPVEPTAPHGMIAYFTGGSCPPGWVPAEELEGRLAVGVTNPAEVAVTVGVPLGDREDRTHAHKFASSVKLSSKDVVAFDGSNNDGAAAASYAAAGSAFPQVSGLPLIQVQACARP